MGGQSSKPITGWASRTTSANGPPPATTTTGTRAAAITRSHSREQGERQAAAELDDGWRSHSMPARAGERSRVISTPTPPGPTSSF